MGHDNIAHDVTIVHLLRSFELRTADRSVAVPPATQRLVAFLALKAGALTRDYVAGALWTDYSQDAANANLRTALWRLRQVRYSLIEATTTTVSLAPEVRVDVHESSRFARRVVFDDAHCRDEDLERLIVAGDLLPGWYDDWVVIERERFRQTRLHALEALCRTLTDQRRYAQAIELGLAAVAGEPLRESAHRAVIGVHLAEGNRCEALRAYELCRDLLTVQLGIEPSSEMRRLRERCVSGDAAVTAAG